MTQNRLSKFPLRLSALASSAGSVASPPPAPRAQAALAPVMTLTAAAARTLLRPQRPLRDAHADGLERRGPGSARLEATGPARQLIERLRRDGLRNEAVLQAMAGVPRHHFVDAALVTQAYEDTSLPIGHGQTISKPSVVARMLELLMEGEGARSRGHLGRTLEIGTGCGYQAAILCVLARQVVSVERLQPLHEKARALLADMRPAHLRLVYGDGMHGHPPNAPYDSIVAAASGDAIPDAWLEQLAVGGRLVSPMREAGTNRQVLMVVDRTEHGWKHAACETVQFVPLKSGMSAK